jgi:peptidoglycan/xylan/chitin deacetylase (PgdA/CDA1 family)
MRTYWIKTPDWLPRLFPRTLTWKMPETTEPTVYLTFDDGPHPHATPFVLDILQQANAYASFFCIGKNVSSYPEIYQRILSEGHTAGNHTFHHLNGWKNTNHAYYRSILEAHKLIHNRIFRPPYGRIKHSQVNKLTASQNPWKIYMWDVLSGDFDMNLSPESCRDNVIKNIEPGSIVVFHDSEKAWPRMQYALPHVIDFCLQQNWKIHALPNML